MGALERSVQGRCIELLRDRGAWYSRLARGSRNGVPDLIACHRRTFLGVEVKRVGGRVRPEQLVELWRIRESGGIGLLVDDPDQLQDALDMLDRGVWPSIINDRSPIPRPQVIAL